jgi:hypothetical protein
MKKKNCEKKTSAVISSIMYPDKNFILELKPSNDSGRIFDWCNDNREFIEEALLNYGGIVFRGFNLKGNEFRKITDIISPNPALSYTAGIAPRKNFGDGVYLSTTIEKRCEIPQHHEMSYFRKWPEKIFFYCEMPSDSGGETTVASTRRFMKKIDKNIINSFEKKEVLYLRNYIEGINSNWKDSFETDKKNEVEKICKSLNMNFEWLGNENLRTKNIAQGIAIHPITKEKLWHNHAHVYNMFCGNYGQLTPTLRMTKTAYTNEILEKMMNLSHENLPANTYYGDGEIFESDIIEEIFNIFNEEKVGFIWNKGDFMLLDNMLAFHGRNPYEGDQRKILTILK